MGCQAAPVNIERAAQIVLWPHPCATLSVLCSPSRMRRNTFGGWALQHPSYRWVSSVSASQPRRQEEGCTAGRMWEGRTQGAGRPPRGTTPIRCKGVFREHPGAATFLRRQPFTHSPGLSQQTLDLSTDLRHKFLAYSFAPPSQGLGASPAHSLSSVSAVVPS